MSVGKGVGQLAVPSGPGHGFPSWMDVHSSAIDVGQARKVLVVRTDHLGDLVLSTPFFETLRRNLPRARITALVTPYTREVLERNPSVDEIVAMDRESADRSQIMRHLKEQAFDVVVALSPTTRAYAIARTLGAPVRAGYIYSRRWVPRALSGVMLTHRAVYHIDALVEKHQPVPHEVEQMLGFARVLGLSAEEVPLRLYPDLYQAAEACEPLGEEAQAFAPHLVNLGRVQWVPTTRRECSWLAVQLAPHWLRPPWSMEAFIDMLEVLQAAIEGVKIVVVYGPNEQKQGQDLAQSGRVNDRLKVFGDLNMSRWAGIMGAARMALSPDTGSIHVAAAMRTPVVAAYEEPTFDLCSQQWAPWLVPNRKVMKTTPAETIPKLAQAAADLWKPGR
jgi:heptosyltransferase-3